jgi:hypothetical protein
MGDNPSVSASSGGPQMARRAEGTGTILDFKDELRTAWNPKNAIRHFVLVQLDSGERIRILPRHEDHALLTVGDRIRFTYFPGKEDKWVENLTRPPPR